MSTINLEAEGRRSKIEARRIERFFGDNGLMAAYERMDDELLQCDEVARLLVARVPGLGYDAIVRLFYLSARHGKFGFWRERRVRDLVDLDAFGVFAAAQYALRPSVLTVEMAPARMRARRSTWVGWIRWQGWEVPPEIATDPKAQVVMAPPVVVECAAEVLAPPGPSRHSALPPPPAPTETQALAPEEATDAPPAQGPADKGDPRAEPAPPTRRRKPSREFDRVRKMIVELAVAYPGTKSRKEWKDEFRTSVSTLDRAAQAVCKTRQESSDAAK